MNLLEKAKRFSEKNKAKSNGFGKLDGCEEAVRYLIENGTKQGVVLEFLKQEAKITVSGYLLKKFCQVHEIKSPYNRGNSTVKKKGDLVGDTQMAKLLDSEHSESADVSNKIFETNMD